MTLFPEVAWHGSYASNPSYGMMCTKHHAVFEHRSVLHAAFQSKESAANRKSRASIHAAERPSVADSN